MIRAVLRIEKSTFSIMRTRGSCEMHEVFFFVFIHEPLIRIKKKVLFSWFSIVFHHFQPCKRMRKHVFAGQNTSRVHCFVGGLSKKKQTLTTLSYLRFVFLKFYGHLLQCALQPSPSLTEKKLSLLLQLGRNCELCWSQNWCKKTWYQLHNFYIQWSNKWKKKWYK